MGRDSGTAKRSTGSGSKTRSPVIKRAARKSVAKPKEEEYVTYLVDQGGDKKFKVTIPKKWRVTFGPWAPPRRNDFERSNNTGTLRFYEGTTIRAAYAPVVMFYDITLDMQHQLVIKQGDKTWTEDSKGNYEANTKLLVESEWVEGEGE